MKVREVFMKNNTLKLSIALILLFSFLFVTSVQAGPKGTNIVEVAIAVNAEGPFAGSFDTLIAAVLAADPVILNTLTGNGQYTVFAPTDDAFADLGLDENNIGTLGQEILTDILLYHVANGRRYSESILDSKRIRTLYGGFLFQKGGVLTDNLGRDATIIVTDVKAANGIIHAINAVVLPYAP
jgi:uncharacterized surface protein with fasciclin (FAS1) repeats